MFHIALVEVNKWCRKKLGVAVRWPGKTRGAFGFALIFLLHFLHQGKKWKTEFTKTNCEYKDMRF